LVKLSVLEYEDRLIPVPLFGASIGLMTGFTYIFPLLGIITLPTAILTVYSILTGDITFVDDNTTIERPSELLEEE
jgi:hypothetical protein